MNAIRLLIVWLWVAIPLGWGVKKSVEKSLPLFGMGKPAAAAIK